MKLIIISLLSLVIHWAAPAVNDDPVVISAAVISSGCNGQNSIVVTASGGDGSFTYSIQCGSAPPITQTSNVFEGIPPCTYTVTAYSGLESASTVVTVNPDPPALSLYLSSSGCSIVSSANGGGGTYTYSMSTVSSTGPWGAAQSSGVFPSLSPGLYYVRVTDLCGQAVVQNISVTGNGGITFNIDATGDQICLSNVSGGEPPYSYTLTSSTGTYTSPDGCFSKTLLGCASFSITVNGACGSGVYNGSISQLSAGVDCVRFVDGHVELRAYGGRPPYTYTVFAGSSEISNTTGVFENLPHPLRQYGFKVTDACGNVEDGFGILAYSLKFTDEGSCDNDTLHFKVWRDCQQAYHFDEPVEVTCISCGGIKDTLYYSSEEAFFPNAVPGQTTLSITTGCEDSTFCRDTLVLHLFAGCDSIRARIADLFKCSYFMESMRWMQDTATVYELYAPDGSLLATNSTGLFNQLSPANGYRVKAISPLCGILTATVDLKEPQDIPLIWDFKVSMASNNGVCSPRYSMTLPRNQGPMYLTGGPDHITQLIDDEHVSYNCVYYFPPPLKAGSYQLSSRRFCAIDTFTFPELPFDLSASVVSDCPGAGRIQVAGAQNESYWRVFFEEHGLDNWDSEYYDSDGYSLFNEEGELVDYRYELGGPGSFFNLEAGTYQVVLNFMSCGVDTVTVHITDQPSLAASISPGVICPGQTTGSVVVKITPGRAGYRIREVSCSNYLYEGGYDSAITNDTLSIIGNLSAGIHCFEVTDSCGNKVTQATGVSYFTDEITAAYQCLPAQVQLQIDSIPFFDYIWLNGAGDTLGYNSGLKVGYPNNSSTYRVQVITPGNCIIEKSIEVHPDIVPAFDVIVADTVLCNAGDSAQVTIHPVRPDYEYDWSDSASDSTSRWLAAGSYTVTATHPASGCTATGSFQIEQAPVVLPVIGGILAFCPGDSGTAAIANAGEFMSWSWSPAGSTDAQIILTDTSSVTLEAVAASGCLRSVTVTPMVYPLPAPTVAGPAEICEGATGTFSTMPAVFASYEWSTGATTPVINAPSGEYSVTVTSVDGCTGVAPAFTSVEVPLISASVQMPEHICKGDTAAAQVITISSAYTEGTVWIANSVGDTFTGTIENGTAFIAFSLQQSDIMVIDSVVLPGYQCPFVLPPGDSVIVDDPQVAITAQVYSNGYNLHCPGDSSGSVSVLHAVGVGQLSYLWSNGVQETQKIDTLASGIYTVTLTDQWQCTATDTVAVTGPPPVTPLILAQSPRCFGIDGGSMQINSSPSPRPVACLINGETIGYIPVQMSQLPPGVYDIELDDGVCPPVDTMIELSAPPYVFADIIDEEVTISLGDSYKILTTIEAGIPFSVSFEPEAEHNGDFQPIVMPVKHSRYVLSVTDTNGCTFTDDILIRVRNDVRVYVPNVFQPGDATNGMFYPFAKEGAVKEVLSFHIYDRWGDMVFEKRQFLPNDANSGWDGSHQGKPVNPATFVWTAKVEFINGDVIDLNGDITIVR